MTGIETARTAVFSAVIERFVARFDFSSLTSHQRESALREVTQLRPVMSLGDARLAAALLAFEDGLRRAKPTMGRRTGTEARRLKRLLRWLVPLAMATAGVTLGAAPAFAAIPVYAVGGTITNPQTGGTETVVALIGTYSVQTDQNHVILLAQTVGDTYSISVTVGGTTTTTDYKVTAVTAGVGDRKSTRLNSSHTIQSRMPSSA